MPQYRIAHLREQGQDLIIVPLEGTFGSLSSAAQDATVSELQVRVGAAGLRGTVVPVWPQSARMAFLAPPPWHPFFQSISLNFVMANINREISW